MTTLKYILTLLAILNFIGCKTNHVRGVIIGNTLLTHQSIEENRKLEQLIIRALNNERAALIVLRDFPNGGAASSYDLGYVLTQVIYQMGEEVFVDQLSQFPDQEILKFKGLIEVGLEYGDNNYDGQPDRKYLLKEFPKIAALLNTAESPRYNFPIQNLSHKVISPYNKEGAKKDIEDDQIKLFVLSGLRTDFPEFNNEQDQLFQESYDVEYLATGCIAMGAEEDQYEYNKEVFTYLGHQYGLSWRTQIREDVLGL